MIDDDDLIMVNGRLVVIDSDAIEDDYTSKIAPSSTRSKAKQNKRQRSKSVLKGFGMMYIRDLIRRD